ncbi:hypothetical protein PHYPSEUDO_015433 [Phytophthora pseudosyringae]|uniref:Uncharacterized protein n=1 Tax=Phytophthora pseudosyringae TaxID=221518 RepID=A0A8T1W3R5_9STRA|nr:hypothetical protein PHYPSEUDO_015433 [Phytophthora pseudosyringae]
MGRPLLPIWKEFVTTVPADADKRTPDVACLHCRTLVCNARPTNLLRHALRCPDMPADVRLGLRTDLPPAETVSRQKLEAAMAESHQVEQNRGEETSVTTLPAERRPVLGKRPRADGGQDNLERALTSIRDVMAATLECRQQELQLKREELEFQKEALATKMEDRREAREEKRRDRREQREADRQERLELARIENEKNLAFLKAVMESAQQRR